MYALWKRTKLGYILGILVFSIFGLIQAGFAGAIFIGFNYPFNLTMAITISICCLSISALLLDSDRYREKDYALTQKHVVADKERYRDADII
jgi:hypothetical protein